MALITLPATPQKGVAQQYELNTVELFALVSESFFTDQTNLSKINIIYQSSVSNQLEAITFIADGSATLQADAEFSDKARDLFSVQRIIIFDKQNGRYVVEAASIPSVASYNVVFPPPSVTITWDANITNYLPGSNGALTKLTNNDVALLATADKVLSPNALAYYEIEFQFNGNPASGNLYGVVNDGGFFVALQGDGTNNPKVRINNDANFSITAYGLPVLDAGVNSWKVIIQAGSVKLSVNGTVVTWGSIGWSEITPVVKLMNTNDQLLGADDIVTPASSPIAWTYLPGLKPYGTDGGLEVDYPIAGSWQEAKSTVLNGDFILEYKVTLDAVNYYLLGYSYTDIPLGSNLTPNRCAFFDKAATTWADAVDSQAIAWTDDMILTPSSPVAAPFIGSLYTVKFQRVGGLITCSMTNSNGTATFTVENSYTGPVYPHIEIWNVMGSKLDYGKVS